MRIRRLRRELRALQAWTAVTGLGLVLVSVSAFRQPAPQRQTFDEINVERINIVEKDGRVRLVIANSARQAVTVVDGRQILPSRKRDAGLVFFNDEGDENGGMTWSGSTSDGTARASSGLSFDQYKQDETITLRYAQTGAERQAGLTIADRPEASIAAAARMNDAATDAERARIRQELVDAGVIGSRPRVFAGRDPSGTAKLALSDGDGKPRLVLTVERGGAARIEFLDAAGRVVQSVKPPQ